MNVKDFVKGLNKSFRPTIAYSVKQFMYYGMCGEKTIQLGFNLENLKLFDDDFNNKNTVMCLLNFIDKFNIKTNVNVGDYVRSKLYHVEINKYGNISKAYIELLKAYRDAVCNKETIEFEKNVAVDDTFYSAGQDTISIKYTDYRCNQENNKTIIVDNLSAILGEETTKFTENNKKGLAERVKGLTFKYKDFSFNDKSIKKLREDLHFRALNPVFKDEDDDNKIFYTLFGIDNNLSLDKESMEYLLNHPEMVNRYLTKEFIINNYDKLEKYPLIQEALMEVFLMRTTEVECFGAEDLFEKTVYSNTEDEENDINDITDDDEEDDYSENEEDED